MFYTINNALNFNYTKFYKPKKTKMSLKNVFKVKVEVLSDGELLTAFKDALQKINDGAGYSSDEDSDLEEW